VIGRDDGNLELWSLKDGKRRNLQPRMPNIVTCVALSGNGEKLLAGSEIDEAWAKARSRPGICSSRRTRRV
jgi:hypothetical protein